jgi:hypothetical protein
VTRRWRRQSTDQAEQHYLVSPRSLAGSGHPSYIGDVLYACGWRNRETRAGRLHLDSPDGTTTVRYSPDSVSSWDIGSKAVAGVQPAWNIALSRHAPVEIVEGITGALIRPRTAHAPDVWAPLREHGWEIQRNEIRYAAMSPDNTTGLQFTRITPSESQWMAWAADIDGILWTAGFSDSTPLYIVRSFSAALASPEPAMRPRGHMPTLSKIQLVSVSVRPSELRAWEQRRIQSARAAAAQSGSPYELPKAAGRQGRRRR